MRRCALPAGRARLAAIPVGPVLRQPVDECLRLVGIQPLAERKSLVLQLFAPAIYECFERTGRCLAQASSGRGNALTQDREVVLIAQVVSQMMELISELADRASREWSQRLQLMPQVLRLLAPFMQVVGGALGSRIAQRAPRAPVRFLDASRDAVPLAQPRLPGL